MKVNSAKDYIEILDAYGESWSNDNQALADAMEDYAKMYHEAKLKLLERPASMHWIAVSECLPNTSEQVFVKYENGRYGVNEWWESARCWKYQFESMIVQYWCSPPLS